MSHVGMLQAGYCHEFLEGVTMHSSLNMPRCVPNVYLVKIMAMKIWSITFTEETCVINPALTIWEDKGKKPGSFTFICPVPSWRSRALAESYWMITRIIMNVYAGRKFEWSSRLCLCQKVGK